MQRLTKKKVIVAAAGLWSANGIYGGVLGWQLYGRMGDLDGINMFQMLNGQQPFNRWTFVLLGFAGCMMSPIWGIFQMRALISKEDAREKEELEKLERRKRRLERHQKSL